MTLLSGSTYFLLIELFSKRANSSGFYPKPKHLPDLFSTLDWALIVKTNYFTNFDYTIRCHYAKLKLNFQPKPFIMH